ncbi:MAG: WYL domain-containing protein, partial [Mesorhizobium sp.]
VMAAWCETRQDFRHFRADRMSDLTPTGVRYPRRRQAMLKEWRATLDAPRSNARKGDSA